MGKIYFRALLFLIAVLPFSNRLQASHAMGADLQYQCLGGNQYRVTLRFYRDCSGIAAPTNAQVSISAPGCPGTSTISLTLNLNTAANCPPGSTNGCEVSQLCPAQLSQSACNWTGSGAAPYPGVRVYEYTGVVTLPAACSNWRIRFSECCRNAAINNLANASANDLSIEAIINNNIDPLTGQPYCNNSVAFSSLPVPFVCANSDVTYNNGAVDVDGDSLVYNMIFPLGNTFTPMTFNAGWSVTNPVKTTPVNTFVFNQTNGQMEFRPSGQEVDVLAVRINEYRNGVLVGSTMRDMQVTILNCAISIPDQEPITNVQNGNQVDSLSVQVCPGTPLQFDILCTDPANHNLTLTSNINAVPSAIPGATMVQIGTGDSVIARINWTPLAGDTGCHNFLITTENDDCPINGAYTRVYSICVFTQVNLLSASTTFCGTPVQLTATGGSNYQWLPSTGPNAVSNPNVLNPTVSPTSDQMYYFTSDCGTDSVFVQSDPPFLYDAGPGGTICQNGQLQLNATTDNLYAPYSFQWVPSIGLFDPIANVPNDSVPNPVASPLTTTNYKLYVTGNNGCTNVDSVLVTVAGIAPNIVAKAQPTAACPGDDVQLNIVTNPQSCGVGPTLCSGTPDIVTVGTGTGVIPAGSPTQYPTVYGHYSKSARHQFLFTAAELLAQLGSGGQIKELSFYVDNIATANDVIQNFEIKMGCTQASALNSWQPNLVTVFTPKNINMGPTTNTGWKTHVLDFPYDWDGTSNLVIDVCFNNASGSVLNAKMRMTPTAFNSVYYSRGNSVQCGTTGTPTVANTRPNTRFSFCVTDVSNLPIAWTPATGPNAPSPVNTVDPVATPVTPVVYHVDVTDSNGCVSSDFVYVNVDTSLRFYAFPNDTFFCSPTSVTFTTQTIGNPLPGNSFSYQWKNLTTNAVVGSNSPTYTFNATTSADYLVTLSGGACVLSDTIRLVVGSSIPVSLIVDSIDCFGYNNGKITAVPSGGIPPVQFAWSNGITVDSIQNLAPGVYSVSVADAQGCSGSATFDLPQPASLTLSAVAQPINCFGNNNGSVTLTAAGGTPVYNYLWNPAQSNGPVANALSQGLYAATVTDANGCTANGSATVNQPTALTTSVVSYNATSFGGNEGWAYVVASGATAPYTFSWSNGANNDSIVNLLAGIYVVTVCDANGCCIPDTAIVTDPPPIVLAFTKTDNLCFGDCAGNAQVSANGGIEPYTFVWSNAVSDSLISGLCAGVYTVTATDSAGVSVTGNVQIAEPSQLVVLLDTTAITCFGASDASVEAVASGGTPGYSYNWTPGGNVNPQTALAPGAYSVVVTDLNNCTAQNNWTLVEPALLTVAVSNTTDVSCFGGNDGTATASAAGGTVPYSYVWTNVSSITSTATGFNQGNKTVTVTDNNGCQASATFIISEPAPLIATVASTVDATCNTYQDGAIDISVAGGSSSYTYLWSNSAVSEDLTTVPAGLYTVLVTDTKNCTASTSATVNEPSAIVLSFGSTDPLCAGDATGSVWVTASGGTPGFVIDWSVMPGASDNDTLYSLPQGQYDVTVQDNNLCSTQGSITISDPLSLNATFVNREEISCFNTTDGTITVSVSGGTPPITYLWNTGFTGSTVNDFGPGSYDVIITDDNGCDTTLNTTFIAPLPISITSAIADSVSCPAYADGQLIVSATGGTPGNTVAYEYSVSGGLFQPSGIFNNLEAGIYNVTIRDAEGCIKDSTLIVGEPPLPILGILPQDSTIDLGSSITLVSSFSPYTGDDVNFYLWSPLTGVNCADCSSTLASPYATTDYTLTVNYWKNCSVSETIRVYVGEGEDVFVPNAFSPNGDGNNDVLEVFGAGLAKANLKIFNRWGELIFDSANQWRGWDGTYKSQIQQPGVYTYVVEAVYLNGKVREKKGTVTLIK